MMKSIDLVWNLFEKTGEIRYYMLYRNLCEIDKRLDNNLNDDKLDRDMYL